LQHADGAALTRLVARLEAGRFAEAAAALERPP
jgi:hypothetical protein